jgi:Prp8 binding protein
VVSLHKTLIMDHKRKSDNTDTAALVVKKPRNELVERHEGSQDVIAVDAVPRTSSLQSPIMLLTGHKAEIYTVKFSPFGKALASGSFDKEIFLWNVYDDCTNYSVLRGHGGAVLELHWTMDGQNIVSASSDKTVCVWDAETGRRVKRLREHTNYVNSCCPSRRGHSAPMVVSGSDDTTARLWDLRVRGSVQTFTHKYPVTCVAFGDSGDQIYTGGLDNDMRVWDLRRCDVLFSLRGHTDTITGMRLSPDGSYLLSNAMDNSVRIWDIRPYAPFQRCVKIFQGVQHNFEKNLLKCSWSPDGSKVAAGSADRFVYVWDTTSRKLLYKLPGHTGSVNEVDFHPEEPIVASCSSDKTIYLGEISE